MNRSLTIDVFFDFICPWCLIGKRNLEAALRLAHSAQPGFAADVRWHGVQLLPGIPAQGLPFEEFYRARLGGEEAMRRRQQQVAAVAAAAGADVDFRSMRVMPNTADAHRLFEAARSHATAEQVDGLLEHMFAAHFSLGGDLGDPVQLAALAQASGIWPAGLVPAGALCGADHPFQPSLPQPGAAGGGVPLFVFDGWLALSGAQSPATLAAAMQQVLSQRAA